MAVLIETSLGDLVLDLYVDERPKTCLNFLKLCKIKYYNFCLFHSVQRNFIAQTGDPQGTGEGGESVWGVIHGESKKTFDAEIVPRIKHAKAGTVSMVNDGYDRHGSQFFLTLREELDYLDGKHTVFGEVAEGHDVLASISDAYCDKGGRPLQDIRIFHTVILEDPFDDPPGLKVPERSPSPPTKISDSDHIGVDEKIDEFEGKTDEEVRKIIEERESKANANILEMVGDIPDADAKPPENVLFVCKLNSATTSEDLEIIFSRFGPILSCEVIKDQKTGDSLQYAFIEFENEEDCVSAYFKMDNVLIDDRRIHVDFSQSLSKVKHVRRRQSSQGSAEVGAKNSSTQQDRYEMVFDDTDLARQTYSGKNGQKSAQRGEKRKHSSIDKDRSSNKDRKHRSRSRDRRHRSRSRDRMHRSRSRDRKHRSRSRDRKHHRSRSRDREERKHKHRSRSRDRKHRSRSHDRSRERARSRSRSWERTATSHSGSHSQRFGNP